MGEASTWMRVQYISDDMSLYGYRLPVVVPPFSESACSLSLPLLFRFSGDQSLDVEGLKEFLKQVDTLPCKVPEADTLQVRTCAIECVICNQHDGNWTRAPWFELCIDVYIHVLY